jgi:hypothetical protein
MNFKQTVFYTNLLKKFVNKKIFELIIKILVFINCSFENMLNDLLLALYLLNFTRLNKSTWWFINLGYVFFNRLKIDLNKFKKFYILIYNLIKLEWDIIKPLPIFF